MSLLCIGDLLLVTLVPVACPIMTGSRTPLWFPICRTMALNTPAACALVPLVPVPFALYSLLPCKDLANSYSSRLPECGSATCPVYSINTCVPVS